MNQQAQGGPPAESPTRDQQGSQGQQSAQQIYKQIWNQLHINGQNVAQQHLLQTLTSQRTASANNHNTPGTTTGLATTNLQPSFRLGPQPEPTVEPTVCRPRPKLPNVSTFDGKGGEFRTWINQMEEMNIVKAK